MTARLTALDIAVVVLYILGTTCLGVWFTRRQKDLKTYFVGGRDVGWVLILASILSTETSIVTFLSVPGRAYDRAGGNLTFLQLSFGYVIGRILISWILLPQYMRGELFTAYQLLRERFNPAVQRTASGLFLITRTLADGLRLFLTGLLFQQFTGWNMEMSIIVVGVVTIIYSFLGGVQAVIWTDLIQVIIYLSGAILSAVLLVQMIPGGWDAIFTVAADAGKLKLLDFNPDPTETLTVWTGVIGGAVFTMASHGADQLMVQRYLCSRSLGQARLALTLSGFGVLLQFALFLMIGVGLYVFYESQDFHGVAGRHNDEVFGIFIVQNFPPGVVGLVVAAVLAAAMSSSINSLASAFITDFYKPLQPNRTEGTYVFVSRIMTIFWGLAQIGVALLADGLRSEKSVVDQVLAIAGFTTGMVLGLFILGGMRRPVRSSAALIGFGVGLSVVFLVWLPQFLSLWIESLRQYRYIAWPWYAPIGAGTTVVVALIVNAWMDKVNPSLSSGPQGDSTPGG